MVGLQAAISTQHVAGVYMDACVGADPGLKSAAGLVNAQRLVVAMDSYAATTCLDTGMRSHQSMAGVAYNELHSSAAIPKYEFAFWPAYTNDTPVAALRKSKATRMCVT